IFGCVSYSHVNQGKLKPRATKCIFLGYPDGVTGYKLLRIDDVKPKIIISSDVGFNKSLMYKDTLKGAGAADSRKEVEFQEFNNLCKESGIARHLTVAGTLQQNGLAERMNSS
nr:retrovirus-related Pol polyprotein from transposon TNT 1-94 [Tanacetum cinerariifolium]